MFINAKSIGAYLVFIATRNRPNYFTVCVLVVKTQKNVANSSIFFNSRGADVGHREKNHWLKTKRLAFYYNNTIAVGEQLTYKTQKTSY